MPLMRMIDGARLNFSHGTHEDHAERARAIRAAAEEVGRPVALIADLQGPKLRIGDLSEPVELVRGGSVTISGEDGARDGDLPILPAVLGVRPPAGVRRPHRRRCGPASRARRRTGPRPL